MGNLPFDQGHRKVSHKSRNGTKRKKVGVHRQHRTKLPTEYERDSNRERRRTLGNLRAPEVEDYTEEPMDFDTLGPLLMSLPEMPDDDYEEAA